MKTENKFQQDIFFIASKCVGNIGTALAILLQLVAAFLAMKLSNGNLFGLLPWFAMYMLFFYSMRGSFKLEIIKATNHLDEDQEKEVYKGPEGFEEADKDKNDAWKNACWMMIFGFIITMTTYAGIDNAGSDSAEAAYAALYWENMFGFVTGTFFLVTHYTETLNENICNCVKNIWNRSTEAFKPFNDRRTALSKKLESAANHQGD